MNILAYLRSTIHILRGDKKEDDDFYFKTLGSLNKKFISKNCTVMLK